MILAINIIDDTMSWDPWKDWEERRKKLQNDWFAREMHNWSYDPEYWRKKHEQRLANDPLYRYEHEKWREQHDPAYSYSKELNDPEYYRKQREKRKEIALIDDDDYDYDDDNDDEW